MSSVDVWTRGIVSPARNVRSTTLPESTALSFVRTNAPPLPGLTCWNSTMRQTMPSTSTCMPFLNWFVEIVSAMWRERVAPDTCWRAHGWPGACNCTSSATRSRAPRARCKCTPGRLPEEPARWGARFTAPPPRGRESGGAASWQPRRRLGGAERAGGHDDVACRAGRQPREPGRRRRRRSRSSAGRSCGRPAGSVTVASVFAAAWLRPGVHDQDAVDVQAARRRRRSCGSRTGRRPGRRSSPST